MDLKAFNSAKFSDRTEDLPVPGLTAFFADGETPVITLRGLTAEEALAANEAADRTGKVMAIAEKLSGNDREAAAAVAEALGISGNQTPPEFSRRLDILEKGSVSPKFDRKSALQLAKNFPTVFLSATTKILHLTGMGRVPGKPQGSGETPASASP